jgi:hypothetical protein
MPWVNFCLKFSAVFLAEMCLIVRCADISTASFSPSRPPGLQSTDVFHGSCGKWMFLKRKSSAIFISARDMAWYGIQNQRERYAEVHGMDSKLQKMRPIIISVLGP